MVAQETEHEGGMALTPYQPRPASVVVRPLATAQEMLQAVKEYEQLKAAILTPRDIQRIGSNNHVKKSGWLRIARAFGITVEPVREQYETDGDDWGYSVLVRAVAPNGASMTGDGACWASEKQEKRIADTKHNVRAHAYTRASNRAISNLVGGGEVSAEEMQTDDGQVPQSRARGRQAARGPVTVTPASEPDTFAQPEPALTWQSLQARAHAVNLTDAQFKSEIVRITKKEKGHTEQDKRNVSLYLTRLEQTAAKLAAAQAEDAAVTFEAVDVAEEADDGGNGDPDLLKKVPGLRGAPAQ